MNTTWIIIICVIVVAVLLCFLLAIANFSYDKFMQRYRQLSNQSIRSGITTLQFVDMLNSQYFGGTLKIVQIEKEAGDAYGGGRLFLSTKTIYQPSIASFTIIAHEIGHAKQDIEGKKLKRLNFLRKLGRIVGLLLTPCLIAGIVMLILGYSLIGFVLFGVAGGIFILALVIKLMTIAIEKDASKKALGFLEMILGDEELRTAKRFLKDAGLTYWADFLRIILGWTGISKKSKLFN